MNKIQELMILERKMDILKRDILIENISEIGSFNEEERRLYRRLLKDFLDAQGRDARNKMQLVSIRKNDPTSFRLDFYRGEDETYTYLHTNGEWG